MTLEYEPAHAKVARANIERAGFGAQVDVRVGAALDTLAALIDEETPPFDFVFIDADKGNNPGYFEQSLRLTRPGSMIVIDNVVRGGEILEAYSDDDRIQGVQRVTELVGKEPRVRATPLQTVGEKGHDGFMLIRVLDI